MIYIYGDSHGKFSFKGLSLPHKDCHESSVTMHRIGRDNTIVNYNGQNHNDTDTVVLAYGEVDCRCHIQRQIDTGRAEDDIIDELVKNYFRTIKTQVTSTSKVIVVGIIPPTKREDYERYHGPVTHAVPFLGSEEDRVRNTAKMNTLLEEMSIQNGYIYFNGYSYYTRPDGTLKHELSDNCLHLGDNSVFLERFMELYRDINKQ